MTGANESRGKVSVTPHSTRDVEEVRRLLSSMAVRPGWVCFTDGWQWWRSESQHGQSSASLIGFPLAAEFVESDRVSFHLRRHEESWVWTRIEDGPGSGDEADIRKDVTLLSTARSSPSLKMSYRTWWRRDDDEKPVRPWRPYVSRFLGWED